MNENDIILFTINNQNKFPSHRLSIIKERLEGMTSQESIIATSLDYQDTSMIICLSVLVGYLGIDRMMIGQVLLGVIKLITFGGCFIWTIIDWFIIGNLTKEYNYNMFMSYVNNLPNKAITPEP
ncbi:TM2 domain-containing protein [Dysgonomonas sp. GY617]|uniref:TM2 domain-containing protein n=1 Tax=Dysgonomonas sp. GY617 TaxID=2780420 RepID=UPI00188368C2|nr:TM2 domain-containing protein [Dysgonomonas sp. GY617]MBF0577889.1 TM2 domain-containing protein [Dysgonomonas sp. GY617]